MRIATLIAASAMTLLAVPANATTAIIWHPGSNSLGNNQIVFQSFNTLGATGSNSTVFDTDVENQGKRPIGSTGGYLSVGPTATGFPLNYGDYLLDLPTVAPVVSFLLGTLDSYNTVILHYANGFSQSLTGNQIIGGASFNTGDDGRVTYDVSTYDKSKWIKSIEFISTSPAFEVDDVASAAPEPATWLMMILGFGLAGGALRRRRKAGSLAAA